jgi:hypothetical protein
LGTNGFEQSPLGIAERIVPNPWCRHLADFVTVDVLVSTAMGPIAMLAVTD